MLLQQSRASYRKVLNPSGGLENLKPIGGDVLLTPDEIRQVRHVAAQIQAQYPPVKAESGETLPWDIEFGFEGGELRLFQIRPLVRYRDVRIWEELSRFDKATPAINRVHLDDAL